jgi:hypothetical protein
MISHDLGGISGIVPGGDVSDGVAVWDGVLVGVNDGVELGYRIVIDAIGINVVVEVLVGVRVNVGVNVFVGVLVTVGRGVEVR